MLINDVCQEYNLTLRTLRYYEEVGLLSPVRNDSNIRDYSSQELAQLELILILKHFEFSLKEIKKLITSNDLTLLHEMLQGELTSLDIQHQNILQKRQIIQTLLKTYASIDPSQHSLSAFIKEQIYIKDMERILPMLTTTKSIVVEISKELIPCATSENPLSLLPSVKTLRDTLNAEYHIDLDLIRIVDKEELKAYEYRILQNDSLLIHKTIDSKDILVQSDHIISNLKALVL